MNSGFDNESTTKVNNNISNNSLKDKIMKKFVFAAIAAMVMVSVSNVFASSKMMIDNSEVVPVDTVAPETPKDSAHLFCLRRVQRIQQSRRLLQRQQQSL